MPASGPAASCVRYLSVLTCVNQFVIQTREFKCEDVLPLPRGSLFATKCVRAVPLARHLRRVCHCPIAAVDPKGGDLPVPWTARPEEAQKASEDLVTPCRLTAHASRGQGAARPHGHARAVEPMAVALSADADPARAVDVEGTCKHDVIVEIRNLLRRRASRLRMIKADRPSHR